jgi:putative Mn2+ efflux pump MntP
MRLHPGKLFKGGAGSCPVCRREGCRSLPAERAGCAPPFSTAWGCMPARVKVFGSKMLQTVFIALALGCDAFAVGMGVGARFCNPRQVFRLAFHFGLFQFMMPLVGWLLGTQIIGLASGWAKWIACGLLFFVGSKMLYESIFGREREDPTQCIDPTRGFSLVMLSLATSIDALGVGLSLGLLGQGLVLPAVWIGLTAGCMTWAAMRLGNHLSARFGHIMETAGGAILIAIAVKLML